MPFFSVIIPVYNVADYLDRCMQTVLRQDFRDYELILVDDGSPDNCGALCDGYASQYDFIRVIHKPNGGLASARNAGTDIAVGQYILWLDSDDWVETNLLSRLHETLEKDPVDFVKYNFYRYAERDIPVSGGVARGLYQGKKENSKLLDQLLRGKGYEASACLHCIRRELLEEHQLRFVSERLVGSEDYLLIIEMMMQAQSAVVLDDCLYHYYCRPGSLTQSVRNDIPIRYTRLYGCLREYLKENNLEEQYAADIRWYYVWKLIHNCCISGEYQKDERNGRIRVQEILAIPELHQAARKCLLSGRTMGERVQTLAMFLGMEPVLFWVFVGRKKKKP